MSFQPLSPTDQQILFATSIITTYGGMAMFGLGMFGNLLNIVTFTCLRTYRSLSTSSFLVMASFSGQLYLAFGLFLSALADILRYNPVARSIELCRTTLFMPRVTVQISLTCLCFSAIDRYLMTSRSARLRSLVTLNRSRIAILVSTVFWCGFCSPNAIYAWIFPFFNLCIPSQAFAGITTYLNLVFGVLLPIAILCLFGFLTWRNLHRARLSSMNMQVTKMILMDVIVVTVSNVPMGCYLIYLVTQSSNRLFTPLETLFIYLIQLISSTQSCGSFYFYLWISPTFRQNIRRMLLKIVCCGKEVHVMPIMPVSSTAQQVRVTVPDVDA